MDTLVLPQNAGIPQLEAPIPSLDSDREGEFLHRVEVLVESVEHPGSDIGDVDGSLSSHSANNHDFLGTGSPNISHVACLNVARVHREVTTEGGLVQLPAIASPKLLLEHDCGVLANLQLDAGRNEVLNPRLIHAEVESERRVRVFPC